MTRFFIFLYSFLIVANALCEMPFTGIDDWEASLSAQKNPETSPPLRGRRDTGPTGKVCLTEDVYFFSGSGPDFSPFIPMIVVMRKIAHSVVIASPKKKMIWSDMSIPSRCCFDISAKSQNRRDPDPDKQSFISLALEPEEYGKQKRQKCCR
ncbi:MAG: hypothetical protein AAF492_01165 [Verrucomicrobiota bacterium]